MYSLRETITKHFEVNSTKVCSYIDIKVSNMIQLGIELMHKGSQRYIQKSKYLYLKVIDDNKFKFKLVSR